MGDPIAILHVDDDPSFGSLTSAFLDRITDDFEVEFVTGATEAMEHLSTDDVDCIISDYEMPGMNGIKLLESVRADHPDLPYILFTGKGSEEIAAEAIAVGVTDYIQKEGGSEQFTVLANRVRNAVEGYRAEREAERTLTQLEAISANSADAIVIIDTESVIRFANPRIEDFFGYSPDELVGESLTTIMPDHHRRAHLEAVERYLESGERTLTWTNVEFEGLHRDRTVVPLSISFGEFRQDGELRLIGIMRELSARKQLEANLREREERFRQLAENIEDVVWMSDPDLEELLYVNPAYERIWGRPTTSLYDDPTSFLEAVHPADREAVEAAVADRAERGYDEVYRIEHPDGEQRWIRDRAIPVEDESGTVYRVVGIATDVTEQQERERALREKQAELRKYKLAVEDSVDLLAACDRGYRLLFANDAYRAYHGVETDEDGTVSLPALFGTEWEATVKAHVDRALDGEVIRYEMDRPGPDGSERTLDIRYYPFREDDGTVVGVVAAMRDVTSDWVDMQKLEQVIARVTDAIVEVDRNWRFTLVNDQAETLYGTTEEELLGRSFWDVFDEALGTRFEEEYRRVMATREPTSFVEYFSQLDGWFDIEAYPNDDGGIAFYFVDVTEHVERQRQLEREQAFIRQTLDALQDIFFVIDAEGNFTRWNSQADRVTGYSDAEVAAMDPTEFFVEADRDRVREAIEEVNETGAATVRADLLTKEGDRIPYEFRATRLRYPDGEGFAICGIGRDISDRVESKRELARRQALLGAQQEAILDGILVVDENREIVSYNERFLDLWDVPEELVAGGDEAAPLEHAIDQLAEPDRFLATVEELYEHPERTDRTEVALADGRVFDRFSTPLVGEDGTYFGRLWTFRDVTARVTREAEIARQNERLEEFASVVSHDLRNPLNVAEGRLELAEEDCPSEHHAAIEQAHDRMADLIEDLLALARQGRSVTEKEQVALAAVCADAWAQVHGAEAELNVETDRRIDADRSRFQQLLENLFRNAVEHAGPSVVVTVGDLPDGFYVEDDGPGIPPAIRDEVFKPGCTTVETGTGFGLSIVHQVAEAHGWTVRVTEGADGGARFAFALHEPRAG
ncbi:MAG: PAS domain S-box protein [Halobacteriales archaeon]